MKSLLNLSQVWFKQQSFLLDYQTFHIFYQMDLHTNKVSEAELLSQFLQGGIFCG